MLEFIVFFKVLYEFTQETELVTASLNLLGWILRKGLRNERLLYDRWDHDLTIEV